MKQYHIPTLRDVAEASNVSLSSVSRALQNQAGISDETRLHVQAVAAQLGYQPNIMARTLRKVKSNIIILIVPNIENLFHIEIIKGIESKLKTNGYSLNIISTNGSITHERSCIEMALGLPADGIIAIPLCAENYTSITKPLIFIAGYPHDDFKQHFIANDDMQGAYFATNHLLQSGKRSVFMIVDSHQLCTPRRLEGYKKAIAEHGIPFDESMIVESNTTSQDGYNAFFNIAFRATAPYGIFCSNDTVAIGVLHAIRDSGLQIPSDIGVVGYDDIPIVSHLEKSLTTVRQSNFNMGEWGSEMLIQIIKNPNRYTQPICRIVQPELIVRKTT